MSRIKTVAAETPFSERLWHSFGYPLRGAALATCVVLALAHFVGLLPSYLGVIASMLVWTFTWHYAAICMLHTAHGYAEPPDVGVEGNDTSGWALTAIHLLAVAVIVLSIELLPAAVWPALIFFALFLPAIDMSLAFDGNMALALNPINSWRIISGFGISYLIPVAMNLLLVITIAIASTVTAILPTIVALPLFGFSYTYLVIVCFHLMGGLIHQRHERFGIDLESAQLIAENGQDDDQHLLQHVDYLALDDPHAAINLLVDRLQNRSAPDSVHLAYRRLLKQQHLNEALLVHGHIWIAAMMAQGEARRALGMVQECADIDPAFMPDDPGTVERLAELAARLGMTRLAVRLCNGFVHTWPNAPEAPRMALLAAQLLADKLDQPQQAVAMLDAWIKTWPHHALRDDVDALARRILHGAIPS